MDAPAPGCAIATSGLAKHCQDFWALDSPAQQVPAATIRDSPD